MYRPTPHLDVIIGIKEQVQCLDVPVDDLLPMNVAEAQKGLDEVFPALILGKALAF